MVHTSLLSLFVFSGFILPQKDNLKERWQDHGAQYALSTVYQNDGINCELYLVSVPSKFFVFLLWLCPI